MLGVIAATPLVEKALGMASQDESGVNLTVAVRVRPLSAGEQAKKLSKVLSTSGNRVLVTCGAGGRSALDRSFTFDRTFGPYATQREVFEYTVRPVVEEAIAGFNCTVFAYGQTGTGKTWTIEGSLQDEEQAGIVPRAARAIYNALDDKDFSVRVSCLEVYNEELADLLAADESAQQISELSKKKRSTAFGASAPTWRSSAPSTLKPQNELRLLESADGIVQCANLEEVSCTTVNECLAALRRGSSARKVAATLCNDKSSRSHVIFCLKVCTRSIADDGRELVVNGQLNLVDLAGSECAGRSGTSTGRGAREAGAINQSLLTLGRVITTLTAPKSDSAYVPYRDSKLTRLLQDSLGGKAKTTLIATVSPCRDCVDESMSTLTYAMRARSIKNMPEQRARYHGKAVLKHISHEVDELHKLLRLQREKNGGVLVPNEQWDELHDQLLTCRLEREELQGALRTSKEHLDRATSESRKLYSRVEALDGALATARDELKAARHELDNERSAHNATRSVERTLRESEARLALDGRKLAAAFIECCASLRAALAEIEARAAAAASDSASAAEISSATCESSTAIRHRLESSVIARANALDETIGTLEGFASNLALKGGNAVSRLVDDHAGALVSSIRRNVLEDVKAAFGDGAAVTKHAYDVAETLSTAIETLQDDAAAVAGSVAHLGKATTDAKSALVSASAELPSRSAALRQRLDQAMRVLHAEALEPAACLDASSAKQRTDSWRDATKHADDLRDQETTWLLETTVRLRDAVTTLIQRELTERWLDLSDRNRAEEVARRAAVNLRCAAAEADRSHGLSAAIGGVASFAASAVTALDDLSSTAAKKVETVARALPEAQEFARVEIQLAGASSQCAVETKNLADRLVATADQFSADLNARASENTQKRTKLAASVLDAASADRAVLNASADEDIRAHTNMAARCTDELRRDAKQTVNAVASSLAETDNRVRVHASHMSERSFLPRTHAPAALKHIPANFDQAPCRDTLIAAHFASLAAGQLDSESDLMPKSSSPASGTVPLRETSNIPPPPTSSRQSSPKTSG